MYYIHQTLLSSLEEGLGMRLVILQVETIWELHILHKWKQLESILGSDEWRDK